MADPVVTLRERFAAALPAALGDEHAGDDPVIRRSQQPRFGDYQANAAMALGKSLGRNPREVAEAIVAHLDVADVCDRVELAGPGFINLTLGNDYISRELESSAADARLGVRPAATSETVVVDYSAPNLAKELHVGHLRSTVIGDALVRVLDFIGHGVIRQNHAGDWGTQFGMLIEHLVEQRWTADDRRTVADLDALYQEAQHRFESDAAFAERARQRVVALQAGDDHTLDVWRALVDESTRHLAAVYRRLGVLLEPADLRGESFYNPMLDDVARELEDKGLARIDDGALCAFPPGFAGRDGRPLPLIVRKRDGGYGYAATDLAAVRFRARDLHGQRIVYALDARQSQHLAMVFATARAAGWLDGARAEHVAFGTILGPDGRPFRTREGGTVKLAGLLDEAVERAAAVVAAENPELDATTRADVARAIGIGAVKYADLSNDRVKDYVFDWDRMLSFDGNTAPYLQYAHARIRSIFRRGEIDVPGGGAPTVTETPERDLALQLLAFDGSLQATAELLQPHRLCTYLFEVATAFTAFYEACPVLRAPSEELRRSRLRLCDLTGRVLACGLGLLGIDAPDRM